jgi:5-formyltetrahydrofolate cyclo-ligase
MIFPGLKTRKARARARLAEARKAMHAASPDAADALVANFPDEIWPKIGDVVSGFIPIGSEIDPRTLLAAFSCEGAVTALPVARKGGVLEFRAWRPGDPLVKAGFGLSEPEETAERVHPTLVLAPMLAFDLKGRRLGWGGGFYDREIALMRGERTVTIVGLAFDGQKLKRVPTGRHDQKLDWIVTEQGAYKARR